MFDKKSPLSVLSDTLRFAALRVPHRGQGLYPGTHGGRAGAAFPPPGENTKGGFYKIFSSRLRVFTAKNLRGKKMKKKHTKTNAVRILEKYSIGYELRHYDVDEHDLSGMNVARKIGLPPPQVFKTLLVQGKASGYFLACIPVDAELDLKECAKVSGNKKVDLVPVKDIVSLTGYVRGGVSPVGTKKRYTVYMDDSAFMFDTISLSAGVRGTQMLINPGDLGKVVEVIRCSITKQSA